MSKKDYVHPEDYTEEHIVIYRTFGSNKERYALECPNIRSAFLTTRTKGAVLLNPSADLIVGIVKGVTDVNESLLDSWKSVNDYQDFSSNAVTCIESTSVATE